MPCSSWYAIGLRPGLERGETPVEIVYSDGQTVARGNRLFHHGGILLFALMLGYHRFVNIP
jgi:hypothetical protein